MQSSDYEKTFVFHNSWLFNAGSITKEPIISRGGKFINTFKEYRARVGLGPGQWVWIFGIAEVQSHNQWIGSNFQNTFQSLIRIQGANRFTNGPGGSVKIWRWLPYPVLTLLVHGAMERFRKKQTKTLHAERSPIHCKTHILAFLEFWRWLWLIFQPFRAHLHGFQDTWWSSRGCCQLCSKERILFLNSETHDCLCPVLTELSKVCYY